MIEPEKRAEALSPLISKLEHTAQLRDDDRRLLTELCEHLVDVPPNTDLVGEGDRPVDVHVVLDGFACRYKSLANGDRQIVAWLVPGDVCDLHATVVGQMDHSISTLTTSRIGHLPRGGIEAALEGRPHLLRAFWWATLVDEAVLREWLVNLGRRPASQRIAHLFCEVLARLQAVGLAMDGTIEFPLTQNDLADTVGLSSVHVNRVIQQLREQQLIVWRQGKLRIVNPDALAAFAEFDPAYLHLRLPPDRT